MDIPFCTPLQGIFAHSIVFLVSCALILLGVVLRRRAGSTGQTGSLVLMSLGGEPAWNQPVDAAIGGFFGVAAIVGWMGWRRVRGGSK